MKGRERRSGVFIKVRENIIIMLHLQIKRTHKKDLRFLLQNAALKEACV